jgi:ABC-type transport system substrate-binding protein
VPSERNRGGQNFHRIQDPELDRALEIAGSTVDDAAREAAIKAVVELVETGKSHILLYRRPVLDPFKTSIKGQAVNIWSDLTWNSQEWWTDR